MTFRNEHLTLAAVQQNISMKKITRRFQTVSQKIILAALLVLGGCAANLFAQSNAVVAGTNAVVQNTATNPVPPRRMGQAP